MPWFGGPLIPLSPNEEIALRRLANGSLAVTPKLMARLQQLGLIEPTEAFRDPCLARR